MTYNKKSDARLISAYAYVCILIMLGCGAIMLDPIVRSHTLVIDDTVNMVFQYITRMGDAIFAAPFVIGVLLGGYYYYPQSRIHIVQGFCKTIITMLVGAVVINLGKSVIGRARPKLFEEFGAYHFKPFHFSTDYNYLSCPSGHTTTWGLLALSMAVIFPRYKMVWYFSAILVGISRVILGAHYVSDVFFSLLLSYGIVYYCHYYVRVPFMDSLKQKLNL
jgi:membrane-associated phospholipid phosphatase